MQSSGMNRQVDDPPLTPRDPLAEGVRCENAGLFDRALEYFDIAARDPDPAVAAEALWRSAHVHRRLCAWDAALDAAERSAAIAQRAGLSLRYGEALNALAAVHQSRGSFDEARAHLERILALTDDQRLRGVALQNLGGIAADSKDYARALAYFTESAACFDAAGYELGRAFALNNMGRAALDLGDLPAALTALEQAVSLARVLGDADLVALATLNHAAALAAADADPEAETLAASALGFFTASRNRWREIECLRLMGDLHARRGDVKTARRCYERGLSLATDIGAERDVADLQAALATIESG
ncbi:MAG: tetratricopeptide repeat protein [Gemmatimonadaceae bacterium]|nr:tetratricopeptide repeat protein [Gemmatimonadaceae bacterium]